MADITIPAFAISGALAAGEPDVITWTDTTDYSTETSSDYFSIGFTLFLATIKTAVITTTPNNSSDNLITAWTLNVDIDGIYNGIVVFCLAFGGEAVPGTFAKGEATYFTDNKFYIANTNATGVTDPSTDSDMTELTSANIQTFLADLVYSAQANIQADETVKACLHEERKKLLDNQVKQDCDCQIECEGLARMDNLLQVATTEFSIPNYAGAQKRIEQLTEICDSC